MKGSQEAQVEMNLSLEVGIPIQLRDVHALGIAFTLGTYLFGGPKFFLKI